MKVQDMFPRRPEYYPTSEDGNGRSFIGDPSTQPEITVSKKTGEGNAARRTFSLRFAAGQEIENVTLRDGRLSFDVVGAWELADLAEPLAALAIYLARFE